MANTLKFGNGEWYGKKDTILAYNDENSNYKPLPFNFSRASNATVVNKAGLIETVGSGEPRIDYKDDTNGALKLEPQRTNRVPNSEDGSTWGLSNITLSSLSGGLNKEYYQITSLGNTGRFDVVKNNWINTTAGTYTASVFAKKGTCDEIILTSRASFTTLSAYAIFNLTSGTVFLNSQVNGSIEPYSDGWYKCSITFTNSGSYTDFASFAFGFNFNSSSTDTLFVAAPQSEISSYATSYIPTSGSAVTRVAEVCNNSGNEQVFNDSDGAIFLNFASYGDYVISLDDGTSTNRIQFFRTLTNDRIYIMIGGTFIINEVYRATSNGVYNKYALSYESGNILLYVNGVLSRTYATAFTSTPFTKFNLNQYDGAASVSVSFKESKIYNTALTDQELIALTTI